MSASSAEYVPRTLVLAFDGTGNDFNDENTNVVRLVSALDKKRTDRQMVYYQPGIGTYVAPTSLWSPTFQKIGKILDQGFAWYLDTHVMGGYRFLMENYTAGDHICLFGFSRGAYTARCLAGMLHKVGLLPKSNEEQISFAYKRYKDTSDTGKRRAKGFKAAFSRTVSINFIGVWDTVSSVGIVGRHLPFTASNTIVKTFRHALSLDERRAKFKPNPWHRTVMSPGAARRDPDKGTAVIPALADNPLDALEKYLRTKFQVKHKKQPTMEDDDAVDDIDDDDEYHNHQPTDVKEVWFAGCHADVGGGSVDNNTTNTLANPSLKWMVNELIKANCGVIFKSDAFQEIKAFETLTITVRDAGLGRPGIPSTFLKQQSSPAAPITASTSSGAPSATSTAVDSAQPSTARSAWSSIQPFALLSREEVILKSIIERSVGQDAVSPMYDQLSERKVWWILEYIPIWQYYQDSEGVWHRGFYWNRGRPREVQDPTPIFHESVRLRMQSPERYQPRARLLEGAEISYTD